ncbi:MAG: M13 family peptidase, partial [Chitinophagaceae bacterium]|nr:M13 family peptidase [Chitinophagaceae bacterium]
MNKLKFSLIAASSLCVFAACKNKENKNADKRTHFLETQYIDSSTKPSDNFYQFVNGKWLDTATIPSDKTSVGGFNQLADETRNKLKALIEEAAKNPGAAGSIQQKVGDFFNSGMD